LVNSFYGFILRYKIDLIYFFRYPLELGWKFSTSRGDIRKNQQFSEFHKFLVQETALVIFIDFKSTKKKKKKKKKKSGKHF